MRLYRSQFQALHVLDGVWLPCCVIVVNVVRTCQQAILLAMLTMIKKQFNMCSYEDGALFGDPLGHWIRAPLSSILLE